MADVVYSEAPLSALTRSLPCLHFVSLMSCKGKCSSAELLANICEHASCVRRVLLPLESYLLEEVECDIRNIIFTGKNAGAPAILIVFCIVC